MVHPVGRTTHRGSEQATQWREEQPDRGEKQASGADQQRQAHANQLAQQAGQERPQGQHAGRENVRAGVHATEQMVRNKLLTQTDLANRIH